MGGMRDWRGMAPIDGIRDLRDVVSDYDKFCHIAEQVEWIDIEERHEGFSSKQPLRIYLNEYEFPAEYVRKNMIQAYVRSVLSSIAFYEEWDKDCWKMSLSERKICLEKGKEFYKAYVIPKELRLVERDWKYLFQEIEIFAGADNISSSEWQRYLQRFEDAMVIETGGCDAADYEYLAIKNDSVLLVACGYWD